MIQKREQLVFQTNRNLDYYFMIFRRSIACLVLAAGLSSLCACGGGGNSTSGTQPVAQAAGKMSVLFAFGSGDSGKRPLSGVVSDAAGNLYGTTLSDDLNGSATLYKLTPGGSLSVLYRFDYASFSPTGELVLDSAGNLYGTMMGGGINGGGIVYKFSGTGVFTKLWDFGAGADGKSPTGGVVRDTAGNLYGTTFAGGTFDSGTVFRITPSGAYSVIWNFGGTGDGAKPVAGLLLDALGNLYGTTSVGGTFNNGTVFKMTPAGDESILWNFGADGDGGGPYASLTMDGAGTLYGTTLAGGAYSGGTAFKISAAGIKTTIRSFRGTDGVGLYSPLTLDAAGNMYGLATFDGASSNGTVFRIAPSGVFDVLWNFSGVCSEGGAPRGRLLLNAQGNLIGASAGDSKGVCKGTVFKISF